MRHIIPFFRLFFIFLLLLLLLLLLTDILINSCTLYHHLGSKVLHVRHICCSITLLLTNSLVLNFLYLTFLLFLLLLAPIIIIIKFKVGSSEQNSLSTWTTCLYADDERFHTSSLFFARSCAFIVRPHLSGRLALVCSHELGKLWVRLQLVVLRQHGHQLALVSVLIQTLLAFLFIQHILLLFLLFPAFNDLWILLFVFLTVCRTPLGVLAPWSWNILISVWFGSLHLNT